MPKIGDIIYFGSEKNRTFLVIGINVKGKGIDLQCLTSYMPSEVGKKYINNYLESTDYHLLKRRQNHPLTKIFA